MGLIHSPSFVIDGLVSHIDAANTRCYPGNGTNATGLITATGCTLQGGVGFSTTNSGFFTFDGSNDYLDFGNSNSVSLLNGTISAWVKKTAGERAYFLVSNSVAVGTGLEIYPDTLYFDIQHGGYAQASYAITDWTHVIMTFNSGTVTAYIDG